MSKHSEEMAARRARRLEREERWAQAVKDSAAKREAAMLLSREKAQARSRIHRERRKAAKLNSAENFTCQEFLMLCQMWGFKCLWCGAKDCELTPDHIVPILQSEDDSILNIQPLCLACNCKKGRKAIDLRWYRPRVRPYGRVDKWMEAVDAGTAEGRVLAPRYVPGEL